MNKFPESLRFLAMALLTLVLIATPSWAQKVLAPGFQVELIATTPEIEHPSVVTCDPAGNLFVGEDPMDMRGPSTKEFDRVVYFRWNADGTRTKTVFCENLAAVFGLAYLDGWLYVMHAPHYTRFADKDGDGVADVREELADGFGPAAGIFGFNDHIVSGIRLGMDGWMYVSVGDKGIQRAVGKDGSEITNEGGGVVRMRPDGTQLQVYSTGTRNHLDVAMNSFDEIFTYDNTDDGLGWWTRFTHHARGGYFGYPFDYLTRPERHLPRISEHGGGSPCGAACYREAVWPSEFRDIPFFAEWGKQKVQCFHVERSGATYTAKIQDFMVPDGSGPFRPVDLCFSPDGQHMYVADWNFDGWTNPKVCGRLYRVTFARDSEPSTPPAAIADHLKALGDPNYSTRLLAQHWFEHQDSEEALAGLEQVVTDRDASPSAKIHALWALTQSKKAAERAAKVLLSAFGDADTDVRAQAVRAWGELEADGESVLPLLRDAEPRVRLQAAIALRQARSLDEVEAILRSLNDPDEYVRFALMQSLRSSGAWKLATTLVESKSIADLNVSALVLSATGQYDPDAVQLLAQLAEHADATSNRLAAIESLIEVHQQADPYVEGWWGTRPAAQGPARAKNHDWDGTKLVRQYVARALADADPTIRARAVAAFASIDPKDEIDRLRALARSDKDDQVRQAVFRTLSAIHDVDALDVLIESARDPKEGDQVRQAAVDAIVVLGQSGRSEQAGSVLLEIVGSKAPEAIAQSALRGLARFPSPKTNEFVEQSLGDPRAGIRASAIPVLAELIGKDAGPLVEPALTDGDASVRESAATTLGKIANPDSVPALIKASADPSIRFAAVQSLALIPDVRALDVYLDAVAGKSPELRDAARGALITIKSDIGDTVLAKAQRNEITHRAREVLAQIYSQPQPIIEWQVHGPFDKAKGRPDFNPSAPPKPKIQTIPSEQQPRWQTARADSTSGQVDMERLLGAHSSVWALAYAQWHAPVAGTYEFQFGSDDQLVLWVDGKQVGGYLGARGWAPAQQAHTVELTAGDHDVWILTGNDSGPWAFSLQIPVREPRFDALLVGTEGKPDPGVYIEHAMTNKGDIARGKAIFADRQGVACVKCHAVADPTQTRLAGPDLAGVGQKYDRREIIRSILEPSNRLQSGYEMTIIATAEGQVIQGVIRSENDERIELADVNGNIQTIRVDDIDERQRSTLSLMPSGIVDGLTPEEFTDLVEYLTSLKVVAGEQESSAGK